MKSAQRLSCPLGWAYRSALPSCGSVLPTFWTIGLTQQFSDFVLPGPFSPCWTLASPVAPPIRLETTPMAFTSVQKIRFDDVDGAGIVYYPQFFHLCHAAFEDFFDTAAPISYPEMIRVRRRGFPTVAIRSEFHAPLSYGDVAIVELAIERIGRSSVTVLYDIRRKRDGILCFEAAITTVLMNLDTQTSEPIDDDLRTILARFLASKTDGAP